MFLLLISLFGFGFILAILFGDIKTFGVNKTVGWAYDISNETIFTAILFTCSQILFIIGYLVLFLLRRKTNYLISIAHFELIILSLALLSYENFKINIVLSVVSLILFFVNILKSDK